MKIQSRRGNALVTALLVLVLIALGALSISNMKIMENIEREQTEKFAIFEKEKHEIQIKLAAAEAKAEATKTALDLLTKKPEPPVESSQNLISRSKSQTTQFMIAPSPTGERPLKKLSRFMTAVESFALNTNVQILSVVGASDFAMIDNEAAYAEIIVSHTPIPPERAKTISSPSQSLD
jgi:hypothetical protein